MAWASGCSGQRRSKALVTLAALFTLTHPCTSLPPRPRRHSGGVGTRRAAAQVGPVPCPHLSGVCGSNGRRGSRWFRYRRGGPGLGAAADPRGLDGAREGCRSERALPVAWNGGARATGKRASTPYGPTIASVLPPGHDGAPRGELAARADAPATAARAARLCGRALGRVGVSVVAPTAAAGARDAGRSRPRHGDGRPRELGGTAGPHQLSAAMRSGAQQERLRCYALV